MTSPPRARLFDDPGITARAGRRGTRPVGVNKLNALVFSNVVARTEPPDQSTVSGGELWGRGVWRIGEVRR